MKFSNKLKVGLVGTGMCLCLANPFLNVMASDGTNTAITIEKPEGWKDSESKIGVTFDTSLLSDGVTLEKVEAKVGEKGSWKDITKSMTVTIKGNDTVYVKATDSGGNTYENNRSIRCYDNEKPTLSASLSNGVLTIQGKDTLSGIASITIEGTTYEADENGSLAVQLTQKDFKRKEIHMSVTDKAGNESGSYVIRNPYYGWKDPASKDNGNSMSATTDTGTNEPAKAPLPQSTEATKPTSAKGTVTDLTVTSAVESKGESVDTVNQTGKEGNKVFYTITTKSGKIFYLVIDNTQSSDNVYFLTEVSEADLLNFTLSDTVTLPDTTYAVPEETNPTEAEKEENTEEKEEIEVKMPEEKSGKGMYIVLAIAALLGVGAGYYFKVYKPKHEYDDDEYDEGYEAYDDDEIEDEDESEVKEIGEDLEIIPIEDEDEIEEDEE